MDFDEYANADPYYKSEDVNGILKRQSIDIENCQSLKELLDAY